MNHSTESKQTKPDWIKATIETLDHSVETMDAVDASRLTTARQIAQREAASRRSLASGLGLGFSEWLNWKSGLTFACMTLVVAAVVFNASNPLLEDDALLAKTEPQSKPKVSIEMIPLLTAKEDMEFYESVNFLLWLENKQGQS